MSNQTPSHLTAAQIGRDIAAGQLDPVDVADYFLDRIGACEDQSIFLTLTPERARAEALASRARHRTGAPAGPLDGVPVAWKDLFDVEDTVTTAGSALYRDHPPAARDAPTVRHLATAGMVCLGKTNLSEFAFSGLGINDHYGTPANPNGMGPAHVPGGSSSGSAVAVARGLTPVAIGTDTSGSVRIPAALCGIVGHQASHGRIDRRQVGLLSMSLDTIGPLVRSVEDCILVDQALRGRAIAPATALPLSGARAIVPESYILDDAEPDVAECFAAAVNRLAVAGLPIERTRIPEFDEFAALSERHGTLVTAEAYYIHKKDLEGPKRDLIDPRITTRLNTAMDMSAYDLLAIQEARKTLGRAVRERLAPDGLLLMPCTPNTAPPIAPLLADPGLYARVNLRIIRNTMLNNFLGLCGLTVPCGRDANDLPVGLLACAAPDEDERLLGIGLSIEATLGFV